MNQMPNSFSPSLNLPSIVVTKCESQRSHLQQACSSSTPGQYEFEKCIHQKSNSSCEICLLAVKPTSAKLGDSLDHQLFEKEAVGGLSCNNGHKASETVTPQPSTSKSADSDLRKNTNQSSLEESHEHQAAKFQQGGNDSKPFKENSRGQAHCSATNIAGAILDKSEEQLKTVCGQPSIRDLPEEVLLKIVQQLHTVDLIACSAAHEVFADLIVNNEQFRNMHTRSVLGFPANQKDITYDIIPAPVAPLQDLWYQMYLYRAAPNMVGIVRPGITFYNLLCFKHLLDTWILQGLGYKYWMFVSDVLKGSKPPPTSFIKCKRQMVISKHMQCLLTKVALFNPEILLSTVNDFETLSIGDMPPSDLEDAWEHGIFSEWKSECEPQHMCEVVSRQRGLALASFFFVFDLKHFIGWCGLIDYSTFRWKDTWSLCKFSSNSTMNDVREISQNLFQRFAQYLGRDYISIHCPNAFMFRGLGKLIQQREILLPTLQETLERTARGINGKLKKILSPEDCKELKTFLDVAQFLDSVEDSATSHRKALKREESKTLEVAVQRYLHRYLNQMTGRQVLELYRDPACHLLLCITCRNSQTINSIPLCVPMSRVGLQHIPLKIWPPHLMQLAIILLPALTKLVRLDVELWKRDLLDKPLSERVEMFVRQVLSAVCLDADLHSGRTGIIAKRVSM